MPLATRTADRAIATHPSTKGRLEIGDLALAPETSTSVGRDGVSIQPGDISKLVLLTLLSPLIATDAVFLDGFNRF